MQGPQIKKGGHAYSHATESLPANEENLNLNPEVYGPFARTCQYFYRETLLNELKPYFRPLAYLSAEAHLFKFFFRALLISPEVVKFSPDMTIQSEAIRAISSATQEGYFSGSTFSCMFIQAVQETTDTAIDALNLVEHLSANCAPKTLMLQCASISKSDANSG